MCYDDALYKFTFYLVTYLLNPDDVTLWLRLWLGGAVKGDKHTIH